MGNFPAVLSFPPVISRTRPVHLQQLASYQSISSASLLSFLSGIFGHQAMTVGEIELVYIASLISGGCLNCVVTTVGDCE